MPAQVCVHACSCPWRLGKSVGVPGAGKSGLCHPSGCWELNSGSLEEQLVLQPPSLIFILVSGNN